MKKVYLAQRNSDLTEGRGPMITLAIFANLKDAVEAVQGQGVMGYGTGDVVDCPVFASLDEYKAKQNPLGGKVYGYRKNRLGKWDYGYVDNRDFPESDPDIEQFERLREKLKGKYGDKFNG